MFEEVCLVCGKHLPDDGYDYLSTPIPYLTSHYYPACCLAKLIVVKTVRTSTLLLLLFLQLVVPFLLLT